MRVAILLLVLAAALSPGFATPVPTIPPPIDTSPGWPALDSVLAFEEGERPIVIEFYKRSCHYCKTLHDELYTDPAVDALVRRLPKAGVDLYTEAGGALGKRFGVSVAPTLVVVSTAGELLARADGLPARQLLLNVLQRAAREKTLRPSDANRWIATGDLASTAGALPTASAAYRRAIEVGTPAPLVENARLRYARLRVRLEDRAGAAEALEPFVSTTRPGPACRPALATLIELRSALQDAEGEARARAAFARLFPALEPPK